DAMAAILDRLARVYEPEFVPIASREGLRRELRESEWHLIFTSTETDLTPAVVLGECVLAEIESPIFVLCEAFNEEAALEAVRVGASEAIRLDDLRRLLPAVA